ncbi:hypothetical protein [Actinoplanes sichuanensis]|uniref:Uncharacterized protein n=1 Tax=Actinoplanes sichuanensis TaxID=512349 RepID=A0ABW4A805_9ACTN|nr:hypothetical protein [Actinoplanes sichuanensis]
MALDVTVLAGAAFVERARPVPVAAFLTGAVRAAVVDPLTDADLVVPTTGWVFDLVPAAAIAFGEFPDLPAGFEVVFATDDDVVPRLPDGAEFTDRPAATVAARPFVGAARSSTATADMTRAGLAAARVRPADFAATDPPVVAFPPTRGAATFPAPDFGVPADFAAPRTDGALTVFTAARADGVTATFAATRVDEEVVVFAATRADGAVVVFAAARADGAVAVFAVARVGGAAAVFAAPRTAVRGSGAIFSAFRDEPEPRGLTMAASVVGAFRPAAVAVPRDVDFLAGGTVLGIGVTGDFRASAETTGPAGRADCLPTICFAAEFPFCRPATDLFADCFTGFGLPDTALAAGCLAEAVLSAGGFAWDCLVGD